MGFVLSGSRVFKPSAFPRAPLNCPWNLWVTGGVKKMEMPPTALPCTRSPFREDSSWHARTSRTIGAAKSAAKLAWQNRTWWGKLWSWAAAPFPTTSSVCGESDTLSKRALNAAADACGVQVASNEIISTKSFLPSKINKPFSLECPEPRGSVSVEELSVCLILHLEFWPSTAV